MGEIDQGKSIFVRHGGNGGAEGVEGKGAGFDGRQALRSQPGQEG